MLVFMSEAGLGKRKATKTLILARRDVYLTVR